MRQEKRFQKYRCEPPVPYTCACKPPTALKSRPVVIGMGPAGLFCGYQLAKKGYRPILLERGACIEQRSKDVGRFWAGGELDPESNVQFGEGGAGAFSDGKLNTLVKDKRGRNRAVLETFVSFGAPEDILFDSKPHIGTDLLKQIVSNMRGEILRLGGEVRFHAKVTDFQVREQNGSPALAGLGVTDTRTGEVFSLKAQAAALAIGHSARDTFLVLNETGAEMQAKAFAIGVRIEHPQSLIDTCQYGAFPYREISPPLPAASYKLTAKSSDGRGVYTFCMCPGGYVVNASSEKGRLAVNGMSYSGRDGENANSAIVVTVTPEDFGVFRAEMADRHPERCAGALSGMAFQRRLEEAAYRQGQGAIPVQRFEDYQNGRPSVSFHAFRPQMKGLCRPADVRGIFPASIAKAVEEGILAFDKKIPGFADGDALLSGVESRTSSPVRILRDQACISNIRGLYPCGEGAGYAGGILSAAMDGLKVSESMMENRYV